MATAGTFDPSVDYYAVLGVGKDVDHKELRKAYRKLAQKWHPDANPGNKEAEEKFKRISAAYDVVGDPDKRKEYDEARSLFGNGVRYGAGPGSGGVRFDNLGDIFGTVFSTATGRRQRRQPTPGPRRGQDLETEVHLSFRDAIRGVTMPVHLTTASTCPACFGTGAAVGTSPISCPDCGGRGTTSTDQGFFSFSRTCPRCQGSGQIVEQPCAVCGGTGTATEPRTIRANIPAGVADGQRVRVKGRGSPGANGGPAGDLFIVVRVEPDPLFGRRGDDVTLTVPITYAEAALGSTVEVPTVDGDRVSFKVPAGTQSGRTFRLRKRGGARAKGEKADMLVTVEVAVPASLSKEEKEAVERLAALSHDNPRSHLWSEA